MHPLEDAQEETRAAAFNHPATGHAGLLVTLPCSTVLTSSAKLADSPVLKLSF
jgi:hypothetical protein